MIRFLLIFFSLVVFIEPAQLQELPIGHNINNLDSLNKEELLEEVLLIYDSLTRINDQNIKTELTKHIFEITKKKDELVHAISLTALVRFGVYKDFLSLKKHTALRKK